jgi:hypothetical protein
MKFEKMPKPRGNGSIVSPESEGVSMKRTTKKPQLAKPVDRRTILAVRPGLY